MERSKLRSTEHCQGFLTCSRLWSEMRRSLKPTTTPCVDWGILLVFNLGCVSQCDHLRQPLPYQTAYRDAHAVHADAGDYAG